MHSLKQLIKGIGFGALVMYYYDPDRGRRRRALARDQCLHAMNRFRNGLDVGWRDLKNRLYGTVAEVKGCLTSDDATDEVLVDRVRSTLGRCVSHASAIRVTARDGSVTLSGPILESELRDLLRSIRSVRGVREIVNQLESHQTADVPALQGGLRQATESRECNQSTMSPAAKLVLGTAVGVLVIRSKNKRSLVSSLLGLAGSVLLFRAVAESDVGGFGSQNWQESHDEFTGHYQSTSADDAARRPSDESAMIDETSEESFPASDAPSFSGTTATPTRPSSEGRIS